MMQKIEFKVGLFMTITTILIMASIGYVAYKKGVFAKDYTYTLSSTTGENITEGMPVVFWGFKIGRVSAMELTERGLLIRIKVPERHNRFIRADSKFVLEKPLIGSPQIIVATSNLNGPPLSPQFVPEITFSNDINELIKQVQPIAQKMDRIADSVATVTSNLADRDGHVNRILRNAETLTSRFAQKESILEMAVGNPESIKSIHESLNRLKDIAAQADGILKKFDTMALKTDAEIYGRDGVLPQVRNILRDLLGKLSKIDITLDNLNKVTGEAVDSTKDLKLLRSELDDAVTAIGNLADELDRKIPFKSEPEIKLP
jgi:phospholipid/cholesterol/gamma-HCH transport system substrate-binding protein